MHWREGFRRIARATAWAFWTCSIVGAGLGAASNAQIQKTDWTVHLAGGLQDARVHAYSEMVARNTALAEAAKPWASGPYAIGIEAWSSEPQRWDWLKAGMTAGLILMWCGLAYVALLFLFRGLRWIARGFFDGPQLAKQ